MRKDPYQAARQVRLLILDVDGVLTDGGLYYDQDGRIAKRFNVQDGLGIKLAQYAGLELAAISGLSSPAVEVRLLELGITDYFAGYRHKLPLLQKLSEAKNIPFAQMAYLGDDWVDAQAMSSVGLPMAVANAQPEIKKLALWTTAAPGGHGAARQAIRFILQAQGRLEELWTKWTREHV